jgi:hypothetical protein
MVRFWVSPPKGAEIVNLGIINKTATFSFVTQQSGTYTFNFENDLPNTIQVTFSYVTNPPIPSSNNSTGIPPSYMLITVIIAITGTLLITLVLRRKGKTQTSAVHNKAASNLKRTNSIPKSQKNQKPNKNPISALVSIANFPFKSNLIMFPLRLQFFKRSFRSNHWPTPLLQAA